MNTKNPFGQMKVAHDDDEDIQTKPQAQTTVSTGLPNLNPSAQDQKKKKKVRPEEKKKLEEPHEEKVEDNEGFSEVKKKGHTRPKVIPVDETGQEDKREKHMKNKGAYDDRNKPNPTHKREFDRKSGTGRGKEVSKDGAGGKHTWGTNPKVIPNQAEEVFNEEDEYIISSALINKPKKQKEEDTVEEKQPETLVEEKVEQVKPKEEVAYEPGDEKRRRKKKPEEEVKKEDLLERPENAMSLEEYNQKLKEKNQALKAQEKKIERPKDSESLNPQEKKEDQTLGISSEVPQKKPKVKVKGQKVDKEEEELSKKVFEKLQVEGAEPQQRYMKERKPQQKDPGLKFQFNWEEFPEL